MKWPDFCSPFIVRRLVPLGFTHDTRFRSVPVSCSPGLVERFEFHHETHRNVANSGSARSANGLRRHTSSVLYVSSAYSAMALSYESPTVPVEEACRVP